MAELEPTPVYEEHTGAHPLSVVKTCHDSAPACSTRARVGVVRGAGSSRLPASQP